MKISVFLSDLINWISARDNVTFLIAVAGFVMSCYTAVRNVIRSRECYTLDAIDYENRSPNIIQFLVCVSNQSDTPLVITEISVFGTICELEPKAIRRKPEDWNFRHTADFPLCVAARCSQYAYLEFCGDNHGFCQLAPGQTVLFEIRSTRKRAQKTVTLWNKSHYLHTRE